MIEQQECHDQVRLEDSAIALTPLEQQILEYVWRGYSTGMIAAALSKSPRTIETYREIMLKKFNVTNAMQMVRAALRQGLLTV